MPVVGINRHRIVTDGTGVTTLVASHGCPLDCKYCINKEYLKPEMLVACEYMSAEQLYNKLKIDDLYFVATNGGVAFGGGESLLYADFIKEFREICGKRWRIVVETSLNISCENLYKVIPVVDEYSIDIKDINPEIYEAYTGKGNARVIDNLKILIKEKGPENIYIRIPSIKNYNTDRDMAYSVKFLKEMGYSNIETFSYIIK